MKTWCVNVIYSKKLELWNGSLNSWFLRIELTVSFDRLTLIYLIDGISNIPNVLVTGSTGLLRRQFKLIFRSSAMIGWCLLSRFRIGWERQLARINLKTLLSAVGIVLFPYSRTVYFTESLSNNLSEPYTCRDYWCEVTWCGSFNLTRSTNGLDQWKALVEPVLFRAVCRMLSFRMSKVFCTPLYGTRGKNIS